MCTDIALSSHWLVSPSRERLAHMVACGGKGLPARLAPGPLRDRRCLARAPSTGNAGANSYDAAGHWDVSGPSPSWSQRARRQGGGAGMGRTAASLGFGQRLRRERLKALVCFPPTVAPCTQPAKGADRHAPIPRTPQALDPHGSHDRLSRPAMIWTSPRFVEL